MSPERLAFANIVFGGGPAVGLLIAWQMEGFLQRATMASMALTCGGVLLIFHAQVGAVRERTVRIAHEGPLRFVPPARIALSYLPTSLLGVAAGTFSTIGLFTVNEGYVSRWDWRNVGVFGLLALFWLAQMAWGLRRPAGLEVSPSGLRGVRGSANVDTRWEELDHANAFVTPKSASLEVTFKGGSAVEIDAVHLGSDPTVVAAVIEHFRADGADRELLLDPRAALRAVEAADAAAAAAEAAEAAGGDTDS